MEEVRLFVILASHCFISSHSSLHLREENHRILEAQKLGQQSSSQQTSRQPSAASEEEKSIVNMKTEGRGIAAYSTCAACRTRQSSVWWKAPKGLSSAVLCEDCGVHWRKYGDLNLQPPKVDNVPSIKQRIPTTEKREGTPLAGPSAKRSRVCYDILIIGYGRFDDYILLP